MESPMTLPDRRVRVLCAGGGAHPGRTRLQRLSDFRSVGAYVLLGEPGSGKTSAFRRESRNSADGRFLPVRDFLALSPGRGGRPPQTLFLDGLDSPDAPDAPDALDAPHTPDSGEAADGLGADDRRRPFDRLRKRLAGHGRSRFRLSCRSLEWMGETDRESLRPLSPDSEVAVLRLEPLDDGEVAGILGDRPGLEAPMAFVERAKARGLDPLLRNPLTLDLLAAVVSAGQGWPEGRRDLFERACFLAAEVRRDSLPHLPAIPSPPPEAGSARDRDPPVVPATAPVRVLDRRLDFVGEDCAIRILSAGRPRAGGPPSGAGAPRSPGFRSDPRVAPAPGAPAERAGPALSVFRLVSLSGPLADYAAARYFARLVETGLPPGRLFALVAGNCAALPTSLRSLAAWLAALSPPLRKRLVALDPCAVAAYGDPAVFSRAERRFLLETLSCQPIPGGGEPVPADGEPVPAGGEPMPAGGEPMPAGGELMPAGGEPMPAGGEPMPAGGNPAPDAAAPSPAWPGMAEDLRSLLRSDLDGPAAERTARFALAALPPASVPRSLADEFFRRSRDRSLSAVTRSLAALAFVAAAGPGDDERLLALLEEIRGYRFHAPGDDLGDRLLTRLYPERIPPSKIWDYLPESGPEVFIAGFDAGFDQVVDDAFADPAAHPPGRSPSAATATKWLGAPNSFWRGGLERASSDLQVAELLDGLSPRMPALDPDLDRAGLTYLPLRLLARGLRAFGDTLPTPRLYDWLRVGAVGNGARVPSRLSAAAAVREWLAARPHLAPRLLDDFVARFGGEAAFASRFHDFRRLCYDSFPPDFGRTCLDRAVEHADRHPEASRVLLAEAVGALCRGIGAERLSPEILFRTTAGHPRLEEWRTALLRFDLPDPYFYTNLHGGGDTLDFDAPLHHWNAEARRELAGYGEIRSGSLVWTLARAYYDRFPGLEGAGPAERVRRLCGNDLALVRAARRALRKTPDRLEIPSVVEILRWRDRQVRPAPAATDSLALPYLAAAEEAAAAEPTGIPPWSDDRLRRAVAFHCTEVWARRPEPRWVRRLVSERPAPVAEVLTDHGRAELTAGGSLEALTILDRAEVSSKLAGRVALPLLRSFPTRAAVRQLPALDTLLRAALRHADRPALAAVIARKTRSRTLTAAGRARWLAAGFAVAPARYREAVESFLTAEPERAPVLAALWWPVGGNPGASPLTDTDAPALAFAIRSLGATIEPMAWPRSRVVSISSYDRARRAIRGLVGRLAAHPDARAGEELDALARLPALSPWRSELRAAEDRRAHFFRDAGIRRPTPEAVRATLSDGAPANAADLRELVAARLRDLAADLRGEREGRWRLFWHDRFALRPTEPRAAEGCRDALLKGLGDRLPEGVSALPTGAGPAFVVAGGVWTVPVEVRRNDDPLLWRRPDSMDPVGSGSEAGRRGQRILVTLWLRPDCTPVPPEGRRPADAAELEQRLSAALPPETERRTSICVLDARPPEVTEAQQVAEPDASWARGWPGSSLPPSRW